MLVIDGFSLSNNNLNIENSYKIKKRYNMKCVLHDIEKYHGCSDVFKRSSNSLVEEWAAHNLLYNIGLFKSHTKDVDLNYPQNKMMSLIYKVLSYIYFKTIK